MILVHNFNNNCTVVDYCILLCCRLFTRSFR